jgi:hypothetical protein
MNDIELKFDIPSCYGRLSAMLDGIHPQQRIFNYSPYILNLNLKKSVRAIEGYIPAPKNESSAAEVVVTVKYFLIACY